MELCCHSYGSNAIVYISKHQIGRTLAMICLYFILSLLTSIFIMQYVSELPTFATEAEQLSSVTVSEQATMYL